jgi:hypothetical protein
MEHRNLRHSLKGCSDVQRDDYDVVKYLWNVFAVSLGLAAASASAEALFGNFGAQCDAP